MGETQLARAAALAELRAEFPVLAQNVNGAPLGYLDNAATTQMPLAVMEAMQRFDRHDRANIHRGVHTLSQRATDRFEEARETLKHFVGAGADHELVFTSGTTDALNMLAHGLSTAGIGDATIKPGDEIIVSELEHHANLVPWQQAARRSGAQLRILRPDAQGRLQEDELARLLGPRTRVFALTACANATGERPPYEAMLARAAAAGALTVLDAAQAVSHETLDVAALACDFMAFSGHKMYGPMGMGALVGRRAALERLEPLRYGGDMVEWVSRTDASFAALPMRLEGGTPNVSGAVGMAAAASFIEGIGRERIDAHVTALRAQAAAGLAAMRGVTLMSPEAHRSAIVSFVTDGVHPHDVGTLLDARGIAVRTGLHCAHPLLEYLGFGPTTRASFAVYNTHDEVERLLAGVTHALEVLR
ncbi:MAG: SufS family cysteine desulfurase [Burkholderiales bacterium]|nr:SufS family cysteine desulfurase [Burkholderiales bacterium]